MDSMDIYSPGAASPDVESGELLEVPKESGSMSAVSRWSGDSAVDMHDHDGHSRRSSRAAALPFTPLGQPLACPFYTESPRTYSECAPQSPTTILNLREHLYRAHARPQWYCHRCFEVFPTGTALSSHPTTECQPEECPWPEKLDESQIQEIQKGHLMEPVEDAWQHIWKAIFPNTRSDAMPYCAGDPSAESSSTLVPISGVDHAQISSPVAPYFWEPVPGDFFTRDLRNLGSSPPRRFHEEDVPLLLQEAGRCSHHTLTASPPDNAPVRNPPYSVISDTTDGSDGVLDDEVEPELARLTNRLVSLILCRFNLPSIHVCPPDTNTHASGQPLPQETNDRKRKVSGNDSNKQRPKRRKRQLGKELSDDEADSGQEDNEVVYDRADAPDDRRFLACIFPKHDAVMYGNCAPQARYRNCASSSFEQFSQFKQHLERVHYLPKYYCLRCYEEFKTKVELSDHLRRPAATQCTNLDTPRFTDRITDEQIHALKLDKKKPSTKDKVEYWYEIYDTIFAGSPRPRPESPWFESTVEDHLRRFTRFADQLSSEELQDVAQQLGLSYPLTAEQTRLVTQATIQRSRERFLREYSSQATTASHLDSSMRSVSHTTLNTPPADGTPEAAPSSFTTLLPPPLPTDGERGRRVQRMAPTDHLDGQVHSWPHPMATASPCQPLDQAEPPPLPPDWNTDFGFDDFNAILGVGDNFDPSTGYGYNHAEHVR